MRMEKQEMNNFVAQILSATKQGTVSLKKQPNILSDAINQLRNGGVVKKVERRAASKHSVVPEEAQRQAASSTASRQIGFEDNSLQTDSFVAKRSSVAKELPRKLSKRERKSLKTEKERDRKALLQKVKNQLDMYDLKFYDFNSWQEKRRQKSKLDEILFIQKYKDKVRLDPSGAGAEEERPSDEKVLQQVLREGQPQRKARNLDN